MNFDLNAGRVVIILYSAAKEAGLRGGGGEVRKGLYIYKLELLISL